MTRQDPKRSTESKTNTQAVRTVRNNRRTEQQFTARSFDRLVRKGL